MKISAFLDVEMSPFCFGFVSPRLEDLTQPMGEPEEGAKTDAGGSFGAG